MIPCLHGPPRDQLPIAAGVQVASIGHWAVSFRESAASLEEPSPMSMTRQNLYGREFKILEGDGLTRLCEAAIEDGGGVLATNTAMMCRPFCASGAGNPIISAHR